MRKPKNYIYLLILLGIVISISLICDSLDPINDTKNTPILNSIPGEQTNFEKMRASYYQRYLEGKNEIQQSAVFNAANEATKEFCDKIQYNATGWACKITQIGTDHGGDHVFLTVSSDISGRRIEYKTWNNEFSDIFDNTSIPKGTPLYDNIGQLHEGDFVYANFKFIKDPKTGIAEASLSELGAMQNPEFIVKFTDIRR